jgi:hypothetical protein
LVLVAVLTAGATFPVGCFFGELRSENARGRLDVARIEGIIAADPKRFGELAVEPGPVDKLCVRGVVQSQADLELLQEEIVRSVGKDRADLILNLSDVRVKKSSGDAER